MTTSPFELRPILITWEKLRVLYNIALAGVVLAFLIADPAILTISNLPFRLVAACVGANVCFTAGPIVEAYACYLANRRLPVTWFLFVPGTLFAMSLAAVVMLSFTMGETD